jgi:hypothetical protein
MWQLVRVVRFSWLSVGLDGPPTVDWEIQHVLFVVYIATSWWWATSKPETCRGVVTEQNEDKYRIQLVSSHALTRNLQNRAVFMYSTILRPIAIHYLHSDLWVYVLWTQSVASDLDIQKRRKPCWDQQTPYHQPPTSPLCVHPTQARFWASVLF